MTETKPNGAQQPQAAVAQPAVQFDTTNVRNSYANVCNVYSTREEVVLNFGLNHTWERGQHDAPVQLTNRIILNPHTAKRVALLLGAIVQQYEKQFGALDIGMAQTQPSEGGERRPHVVK